MDHKGDPRHPTSHMKGLLLLDGGTVCHDDGFIDYYGEAICRDMGYETLHEWDHSRRWEGQSRYAIKISFVRCTTLEICGWTDAPGYCEHSADIFLDCRSSVSFGIIEKVSSNVEFGMSRLETYADDAKDYLKLLGLLGDDVSEIAKQLRLFDGKLFLVLVALGGLILYFNKKTDDQLVQLRSILERIDKRIDEQSELVTMMRGQLTEVDRRLNEVDKRTEFFR